jgi:hypothetical protein
MLVNQIFGHTIKNQTVINNNNLPYNMKKNNKKNVSNYFKGNIY